VLREREELAEQTHASSCPICRSDQTRIVLELAGVPTDTNRLWRKPEDARSAARGTIALRFCEVCDHLFNGAYDDRAVDYEVDYENSQMFSRRFQDYARSLAQELSTRYDLAGKEVIEVGGGRGDFLGILCAEAGCRGTSFGPSYAPAPDDVLPPGVTFVTDYFTEKYADVPADLILSRHVLEHFEDPETLVRSVRATIGDRPDVSVYFEVPNGEEMIRNSLVWEAIYQHPSYFTKTSLRRLFESCGFDVVDFREQFDGQFLAIEAKPRPAGATIETPAAEQRIAAAIPDFAAAYDRQKMRWRATFERLAGRRTLLWGAGAKGVTFLNVIDEAPEAIMAVVDVNPRKLGRYIAGTGHEIISSRTAMALTPDCIVVANPIYLDEIKAMMDSDTVEYLTL
jgi:hypothetical protein